VKAWVESGQADPVDYKIEANGIKIAPDRFYELCSGRGLKSAFKTMTDAELRAHYGRLEAESPGKVGILRTLNFCSCALAVARFRQRYVGMALGELAT
jgi:hypothetical protein